MPTTTPPGPTVGWRNWAGNQHADSAVAHPASTDEVADLVSAARAGRFRIKPVGSGHSFTGVALTDGLRLELDRLAGLVSVDRAERLVTVRAGTPLWMLNRLLAEHGLAMPNLGDIDRQTVSGALSTGTHGTGAAYGCLATFIEAFTLVTGGGEVLRCDRSSHPDVFAAGRVAIGALGVLTELTLRCVDAFVLRADERPASLAGVLGEIDSLVADNDHMEFYWFPYTERVQLKRNNRVPVDDRPLPRFRGWVDDELLSNTVFAGACRLGRAVPSVAPALSRIAAGALSAREYTARSDRVFVSPRRVRFTEMEYGVPREALPEVFEGLRRVVRDLPFKVLFPVEVRFSAADDIWLSHGYRRDSAYLAIHQYVGAPYEPYFHAFERVAVALGGRPHWGKLHYLDAAALRPAYPRFDDFLALRERLDPDRILTNAYLERVLGSDTQ